MQMIADGTDAWVSITKGFLKTTTNNLTLSTQQVKPAAHRHAYLLLPSSMPSFFIILSQGANPD